MKWPGWIRRRLFLGACGCLAATRALATTEPPCCTVPCAIVLVGHHDGVADPYGRFLVVIHDDTGTPIVGGMIAVDFSACCPGMVLSNTQPFPGMTHADNSAIVTALTDNTGTASFCIEGAAAGAASSLVSPLGCATISMTPPGGSTVLITNGIDHPLPFVAVPDLDGAIGTPGVDITDLAFFITDKNAYTVTTANFRQRSDFDFHLPLFNCSVVFNPASGFGVNVGDLSQWVSIKNAAGSFSNGPFPVSCP